MNKKFIDFCTNIMDATKKYTLCLCSSLYNLCKAGLNAYNADNARKLYIAEQRQIQQTINYIIDNDYQLALDVLFEAITNCAGVIPVKLQNFPKDYALAPYVKYHNEKFYMIFKFYYKDYDSKCTALTMKAIIQRELDEICYMRGLPRFRIQALKLLDNKMAHLAISHIF